MRGDGQRDEDENRRGVRRPKIHHAPSADETRDPTMTDRLIAPENMDAARAKPRRGVTSARPWPVGGITAAERRPRAAIMAPAARAPM